MSTKWRGLTVAQFKIALKITSNSKDVILFIKMNTAIKFHCEVIYIIANNDRHLYTLQQLPGLTIEQLSKNF